jgi:hypothetical protein
MEQERHIRKLVQPCVDIACQAGLTPVNEDA